ncbi:MAG: caspase family protein [Saprospiraceae bacterium]
MRITTFLIFLSLISFDLAAQANDTLHLITSIDVVNSDIAQGCSKDYQNANELFKAVAEMGGMNYRPVNLRFDRDQVEAFVHNFQCGPNDVVVFLYSGHGFQYDNDGDLWPWPHLFYCNRERGINNDDCELDLEDVYDLLVEKNPRMSITLGNSCNDPIDSSQGSTNTAGEANDFSGSGGNLQKIGLFTNFRGHILASASSPGQGSYTTDENGAYFIVELFKHIAEGLDSDQPTSWKNILEQTKNSVKSLNSNQTPQYRIE